MSEKTLKTLAGVVAVLLVLYIASAVAPGSPGSAAANGGALAAALEEAGAGDAATIRIVSTTDTIELQRVDGGWTASGHPADTARVAELFAALREARIGHLASSNPANHGRLGVADGAARVLEFGREGGEPLRLLVGDSGASYAGAYLRLPGRDEAYLVHGAIRGHATRRLDDWRDRTIASVDTAAVRTLEISRGGVAYTLARGDGGWTLGDAAADADVVGDVLRELARLEATGFAVDAEPGEPYGTVTALDAAGRTLASVSLAEGGEADLLASVPGNATVFELPRWRAERLVPAQEDVEGTEDHDA